MSKADLIAPLREAHHRGEYVLGTPFKVHTVDRGTNESMRRQAKTVRFHLLEWLDKKFALGLFSTSVEKNEDGGYDIFVAYHGEAIDPQRKGKWKKPRRHAGKRQVSRST